MKISRKRSLRIAAELLCLILALSMMLCTVPMMAAEETQATEEGTAETEDTPKTVKVVCAARDIPQGTRITESHLTVKEVLNVNIPTNIESDPADIVSRYATMPLVEGEYVYMAQTSKDMVVKANDEVLVKDINTSKSDFLIVTDYVRADTGVEIEFYLQQLIDENPNKTLYFPAGEYILGSPIGTPADASYSVSLLLDDGAILKASDKWKANGTMNALVCLGASMPKNDIYTAGSYYSIQGGILDANNKTDGLSIDSGRESVIRNLCIKNAKTGILVKNGANNKSSDCDFEDITIIGSNHISSVGMEIIGYDNTFSNIRIYGTHTGIIGTGAGNFFKSIYIINTAPEEVYSGTKGFGTTTNNWYSDCYVENYETAYTLASSGLIWDCTAAWTSDVCVAQTAFSGGGSLPMIGCKALFRDVENAEMVFSTGATEGKEKEVMLGCLFDQSLGEIKGYENLIKTPVVCP